MADSDRDITTQDILGFQGVPDVVIPEETRTKRGQEREDLRSSTASLLKWIDNIPEPEINVDQPLFDLPANTLKSISSNFIIGPLKDAAKSIVSLVGRAGLASKGEDVTTGEEGKIFLEGLDAGMFGGVVGFSTVPRNAVGTFIGTLGARNSPVKIQKYEEALDLARQFDESDVVFNFPDGTKTIADPHPQRKFDRDVQERLNLKVLLETGWLRDPEDGLWRFWIDDRQATFHTPTTGKAFNKLRHEYGGVLREKFGEAFPGEKVPTSISTLVSRLFTDQGEPLGSGDFFFKEKLDSLFEKATRRATGEEGAIDKDEIIDFKLEDFFEHKELFATYPELRNLPVRLTGRPGTGKHVPTMFGGPGRIHISAEDFRAHPQVFKEVLLHEVQHAVQAIEQFGGKGMNTKSVPTYLLQKLQRIADKREVRGQDVSEVNETMRWIEDVQRGQNPKVSKEMLNYHIYFSDPGEAEARLTEAIFRGDRFVTGTDAGRPVSPLDKGRDIPIRERDDEVTRRDFINLNTAQGQKPRDLTPEEMRQLGQTEDVFFNAQTQQWERFRTTQELIDAGEIDDLFGP